MLKFVLLFGLFANGFSLASGASILVSNGCSLKDAIRSANADASRGGCTAGNGSDVIITPDLWNVTITSTLPDIDTDITIRTETTNGRLIISGGEEHRIFRVRGNGTRLTLNQVELVNGAISSALSNGGGAIRITDAEVIINNSKISNNFVKDVRGAGIFIKDGTLEINNSLISDNETEFTGVLTPIQGAGIFAENSQVTITNTTFMDNYVPSNTDAGSSVFAVDSTIYITGSLFNEEYDGLTAFNSFVEIENSTMNRSQIQYTAFNDPLLKVRDGSTLKMNHVTVDGKGFVASDSVVELSNSIIAGPCYTSSSLISVNTQNLYREANCGEQTEFFYLPHASDNGGPTLTTRIEYNSPAVNFGDPDYCLPTDQTGALRGINCDSGAYEVNDVADVSVELVPLQLPPYAAGQLINATLVLNNNGPAIASPIQLDMVGSRISVVHIDSLICEEFPCQWPFLSPGSQVHIPLILQPVSLAALEFSITAEATSLFGAIHTDPINVNNTDTFSGITVAGADLQITKNLTTNPPYFVGQTIQYALQVRNLGNQVAENVVITESPSNLSIENFIGCNFSNGNTCSLSNLGVGAQRDITVETIIMADFFDNSASVIADTYDPNLSNNTDNQFNGGAVSSSDLKIGLELLTDPPYYSEQFVQYRISIQAFDEAASNIKLYSDLPGAIYLSIDTCSTLPCEIPFLGANQTIELEFDMFAPVQLDNIMETMTHTVSVSAGQTDPDLSNNSAILNNSLNPAADIDVNLYKQTQEPHYVGQNILYRLDIFNLGFNNAPLIETFMQPENLNIVSVNGISCQQINCVLPVLDVLHTEEIFIVARPVSEGNFDLSVSAESNIIDPDQRNNFDNTGNNGTALALPNDLIFSNGFENLAL